MKIVVIKNESKELGDYIEAIKQIDEDALVRGYLVADKISEIVTKEIGNLEYPLLVEGKRIHAKTFGNFEVYIDGIPVSSKYNKTRELFAFLIDKNGALADTNEIMTALWDGDTSEHISYLKNIRSDMIATLKSFGVEDCVVKQRGRLGVIPDLIDCDYYKMLAGDKKYIDKYQGQYMSQYSWGEFTNGILMDIKEEQMYRK